MNKVIIFRMINGEWEYITWTQYYESAKMICEELNRQGYSAKITDSRRTAIQYFMVD